MGRWLVRRGLYLGSLTVLALAITGCAVLAPPSGLGNNVVSGPPGPSGEDHDNAFRSLAVHPTDPDVVIVGTERNGIVLSSDGGATWSRKREGLWHWHGQYPEIWDIAFDPENPQTIYAATLDSPGPPVGNYPSASAGLYKSTDAGETWNRMTDELPNSRITSVQILAETVVIGVEGGTVTFSELVGQYFEGGIYRSVDGGEIWDRVTVGPQDGRNGYWQVVAYGENGAGLITFGLSYSDQSENLGFLRSTDTGCSWEPFGAALRPLLIHAFAVSSDGGTIYANERDTYVIRTSRDGGSSWQTSSINQANGPIAASPEDDALILYAAGGRLYRSPDGLANFELILETTNITDIVLSLSDPTIVYAVADGYLIFKSTNSGRSFVQIADLRADVLNR